MGVNGITDIDVSYTIFDKTESIHWEWGNPVAYNSNFCNTLPLTIPQEGANIPVAFKIEKVNGAEPSATVTTAASVTTHALLPENGYDKKMVVEEATSSICGWCVRGIVGMEKMFENYGNEAFIPISAHSRHDKYKEETSPVNYDDFWDRYITHNPTCLVNRNFRYGITDPNFQNLEWIYSKEISKRAIAEIRLKGYEQTDGCLSIDSEVSFACPEEEGNYSVAYVLTEDNVGPYVQSNAYSGSEQEMGGWETLPKSVRTYYQFVARAISDFDGTPLIASGRVEQGKVYSHSDRVSLEKVSDMSRVAVIGMVINDKTGRIENAVRMPLKDMQGASVEDIMTDDSPVEYYDLSGRRLSSCPASGFYIEKKGAAVRKVTAIR